MRNIILTSSLIALLVACGSDQTVDSTETNASFENSITLTDAQSNYAGIETGTLSSKQISSTVKLNGKIDVPPQSMVSISVPMGGYLKSTKLMDGMYVQKGEVLAVMEDVQYVQLQQDYLMAKAQFIVHESEFNRQKELNQSKATSDKVFEQAKASYQTQRVVIKSLEEKLKLIGINPQRLTTDNLSNSIHIYAPISGYVAAVNVNIGKYVNPSDVLFELVNPTDIFLSLTVFEKDINKLEIGQKLFASTTTDPQKKYECEVFLISKNLENNNATQVQCRIKQSDKSLLPGMFMSAEIELTSKLTTALPEDAIVRFENKQFVFISTGKNQFEMTEINIGNTENGYTEILSTSLSEKTIVTNGAYNLLMAIKNKSEE